MGFLLGNLKGIIFAIIALGAAALVIKHYQKIKKFLLEVRGELGKVAWSGRQELMDSTVVVIVITAITGLFIGIIDILLSKLLSLLFK